VTSRQALKWVERNGIVLQAARGPVPNLASAVAGEPIIGSWWAHPKSKQIFKLAAEVCENPDILVCKLVGGKITYVHRRLWPYLVKLASRFPKNYLAKVWDEHTPTGKHVSRSIPFPKWVPSEVLEEARRLSVDEADRVMRAAWNGL